MWTFMLEVKIVKREALRLAPQPCLDNTAIRDTCGLENSTLSSSQWVLTVLARARRRPSGVQVPWPHLSTDNESRPLTLPRRALLDHHHPLLQENLAQGLVLPLGCSTPRVWELLEVSHPLPWNHVANL